RTEALAFRVVYTEPALDGLPDPLREIVARCLAKDPQHRPAPAEVIAALTATPASGPGTSEGWLPEPVERLAGLHQPVATAARAASPATGPQAPAGDSAVPTRPTRGSGPAGITPAMPAAASYARPQQDIARPQRDAARRPRGWVFGAVAVGVLLV